MATAILHLLIDAVTSAPTQATPEQPLPPLPRFEALLKRLHATDSLATEADAPDTPFERALALACGLPGAPGQVPWAAFERGITGEPCAWLRPCHWQLGLDSVTLLDPARLQLSEIESRTLLDPVRALMVEDGMALDYVAPDRWLARGALFRALTTWSVRRAVQQTLTREVLASAATAAQKDTLRRHQLEWQMLLHNHPVNDAREGSGQWFVNALWIEGAGELGYAIARPAGVVAETRLADAGADPRQRTAAWQAIADERVPQLQAALQSGREVRLTLCGPRQARTYASGAGISARVARLLHPVRLAEAVQAL